MTGRADIEHELIAWMQEPSWQVGDARFERLALSLFAFQFEANPAYGRFCQARGGMPPDVKSWRSIPAVPAGAFKEMALRCFPESQTAHVFRTSGTSAAGSTRGAPETTARRGELHLDTLALYEASLMSTLRTLLFSDLEDGEDMTLRILAPSGHESPDSSLSHMFGCLVAEVGDAKSGFDVTNGTLQAEALIAHLEEACRDARPMALLGTAFAFVHMLDAFGELGARFVCPAGSRIMETGGFKGRSRELSRDTLHAALHESLGIEPTRIVNQYGMTELGSQFYDSLLVDPDGPRRKLGPPWARVRLIDPETGHDIEDDAAGIIVIHDLSNTGSVAAIQTADLGRWVDAGDPADRAHGRGFEVLGRQPGAEARGCSIAADLMLGDDGHPGEPYDG